MRDEDVGSGLRRLRGQERTGFVYSADGDLLERPMTERERRAAEDSCHGRFRLSPGATMLFSSGRGGESVYRDGNTIRFVFPKVVKIIDRCSLVELEGERHG